MTVAMRFVAKLARDQRGSVAIETAIVTPVLILMSLGAFQASGVVARQQELQSGAAEAAEIALAKTPTTEQARTTLRDIVRTSLGLADSQVSVTNLFRCGMDDAHVDLQSDCITGDPVATYIRIDVSDTYVPEWTHLGIGGPIELNVVRTVQIS